MVVEPVPETAFDKVPPVSLSFPAFDTAPPTFPAAIVKSPAFAAILIAC